MREETRCYHIGYSFRLAARVLLYASSHRQDNIYHILCYTSRGALAGTRNSSMGPPHEGSIRRPITPWAKALTTYQLGTYIPLGHTTGPHRIQVTGHNIMKNLPLSLTLTLFFIPALPPPPLRTVHPNVLNAWSISLSLLTGLFCTVISASEGRKKERKKWKKKRKEIVVDR